MPSCQWVIERFLAAIATADVDQILDCLAPEIAWQNVPHPPARGLDEVRALFTPLFGRAERARWDVVSASYGPHRAWLERVDRFWIDGTELAVACNGVFDIDPRRGMITSVRDYVDLGEWRARAGAML